MSAEQYRNELDQLHASPELKARLAALQRETPPAAKPSKLRLAKRAGASVVAAAACLMLCVAVWRGEMLSGKGGFSAASEHSTQMDEAMVEAAAPESGTETAAAENPEAAAADGAADAPGADQKTEVANPSAASGAEAITLPQTATLRINGELYRYAGRQSDALRCGMMDGTITAVTASGETPTADNQANFGTVGMGYQYGAEGTVEVYLEEEDAWLVFEAVEEGEAQP